MTDYIWHVASVGGMFADDPTVKLVVVLAWHGETATVIDINRDGLPLIDHSPYQIDITFLRLGPGPETT